MHPPDLNLLVALDVLLSECSVARAAERLRLSPSAMSRTLTRLRQATGDPLLVRAGRALVPTPRALELRGQVGRLVDESEAVLRPAGTLDPARLERGFTLRAREGFVENFGADLIAEVGRRAPGVRLRFVHKPDKDSTPLRDGEVDLEVGVIGRATGPEVMVQALFRDRFIGVVRMGHPLALGEVTPQRYAQALHIGVSRGGPGKAPVDEALGALGLARGIAASVGSFSAALAVAQASDLVATVPDRYTASLRRDVHAFDLPLGMPDFTVSLMWHPRLDADPAHRWLRGCVRGVCGDHGASPGDTAPAAATAPGIA